MPVAPFSFTSDQIVRHLDVGLQFDVRAVQRVGMRGLQALELLPFQLPLALAQLVFGQQSACPDRR